MNKFWLHIMLIVFWMSPLAAQDTFQLAPPYMRYGSVFFKKQTQVRIEFAHPGTQIHYTTNGLEPTQKDPVYKRSILIKNQRTTLKAKAFGEGFHPSEIVEATFFKQGLTIEGISTTLPHERYPGTGKLTLTDGLGGIDLYSSKTWMGFQKDTVTIMLTTAKYQKIKQVMLHAFQNQGAWIFLPQKVEVYVPIKGTNEWALLVQKSMNTAEKVDKSRSYGLLLDLEDQPKTSQLILKIYPITQLPEWHPGKGNPAWLFIDEVKVY
ncbi:MAG: chitobiase/beta-hexosaminidase C-terminal domain-containing protein [Saprospiraceae bacterium]|nr:chitobiase/beta-hexosaminidase C-terminal domain-containing protein [Saprospiraceae bacterium]